MCDDDPSYGDEEYDLDNLEEDLVEATDASPEDVEYIVKRVLLYALGEKLDAEAEREPETPFR